MFGQDREQMRRFFGAAWQKRLEGLPLEPVELLVTDVVADHPEYHALLAEAALAREYPPELGTTNPFLHMGMHIAIREQVAAGRPADIAALHQAIAARLGDVHDAEHRMMDCLGEALWRAQRDGGEPDEAAYLECLRRHSRG